MIPGVVASSRTVQSVQAVRFSAYNQVYTRSATGLNASTAFTWCAWMKIVVDRNANTSMLSSDNAGANYHELWTGANGTAFGRGTTGGDSSVGIDFTVGTWYFIASTKPTGSTGTIYWSTAPGDALIQTFTPGGTGAGLADANTFRVGGDGFGSNFLNGSIAAVKVWQAVLTKAELETEKPKYAAQRTANLWAAYSFRAGPQTTDDSGNARTLTAGAGTAVVDTSGPPIT